MALWLADIQHSRNTHLAAHGILGIYIQHVNLSILVKKIKVELVFIINVAQGTRTPIRKHNR